MQWTAARNAELAHAISRHHLVEFRVFLLAYWAAAIGVDSPLVLQGVEPFRLVSAEERSQEMRVWQPLLAVVEVVDDVHIEFDVVGDRAMGAGHEA